MKQTFSYYNKSEKLGQVLDELATIDKEQEKKRRTIRDYLFEDWLTTIDLEATTGISQRKIRSKIEDSSLVGLLWEKQWYILRESAEDAGYDI